jgi:hypothetical protein
MELVMEEEGRGCSQCSLAALWPVACGRAVNWGRGQYFGDARESASEVTGSDVLRMERDQVEVEVEGIRGK